MGQLAHQVKTIVRSSEDGLSAAHSSEGRRSGLPDFHPHEIFPGEPALRADFITIHLMRQQACVAVLKFLKHIRWSYEDISVVRRYWRKLTRSWTGKLTMYHPRLNRSNNL